ncbi:MAG: hypothetical protein ACK5XN_12470, partial [Bacteroidota bacterium]
VYARAKTVGLRPQSGQYGDASAVERALQFVRDWGESNLPTQAPKLTGGLGDTYRNKTIRNAKGDWVSAYTDLPGGSKQAIREDKRLGGLAVKPSMQVWDTATMSSRSKPRWSEQMKAKENYVYDKDAQRYKSTTRRDSNAITAFEQKQKQYRPKAISASQTAEAIAAALENQGGSRYRIVIDPKNFNKSMKKSQSMRKPSRHDLYGHASMGGRAMMKSVSSLRNAGTRHLVGGYRGGTRLHKAATPTLATRNFRAKYE